MWSLEQVRNRYLKFFEKKGHTIIPSSSIVPQNDPTTLFTGSGMQPMVPYLLGKDHPEGNRLVDSQKCIRADDIDEVGDNRHLTFFEMLGNWSLGDYFRREQLSWIFEFLTDDLGIDPKKLYITAFFGDDKANLPKDDESVSIWKELFLKKGIEAKSVELLSEENASRVGMQDGRIFFYGSKKNWWSRSGVPEKMPDGEPGGPDSEIFYEFENVSHDKKFGEFCHPNCDCGKFLEIGNSVFMEYVKKDGKFLPLPKKNVDFGGGLERITSILDDESDVFKIDVFKKPIEEIEKLANVSYINDSFEIKKKIRIICDHIKASIFMIADGVVPSNKDRGYVLRRFIRRALFKGYELNLKDSNWFSQVAISVLENYSNFYQGLEDNRSLILDTLSLESKKFYETLESGLKLIGKMVETKEDKAISGEELFNLFTTYGFPVELTLEVANSKGFQVDMESFKKEFAKHKELSKAGTDKKFKGGLADNSEMSVRYHTATHMLNKALREVLGDHVIQRGSNITPERLRFDFPNDRKMTQDEIKKVEDIVNKKISEDLPVSFKEIPLTEAKKLGAMSAFGEKYGEVVRVYQIGSDKDVWSLEFCGGPHVNSTGELNGVFKIVKEEAVSSGVRRIKAVLLPK